MKYRCVNVVMASGQQGPGQPAGNAYIEVSPSGSRPHRLHDSQLATSETHQSARAKSIASHETEDSVSISGYSGAV